CWFSLEPGHLFISSGAKRPNNFVNQLGIIGWIHADRIAYLKVQSPPSEIELKMTRVLFRFRPAQPAIDQHPGGKRIGPRVRQGGNRRWRFKYRSLFLLRLGRT